MEQKYQEEIEIDILDLLYQIMMKWRMILAGMLIGALALGGISLFSSYRAAKAAKNATTAEVSSGDALEADQKEAVLTVYDQVKGLQKVVDKSQEYQKNSILMDLDASDVTTGTVTYLIKVSDAKSLSAVEKAYKQILVNGAVLREAQKAMKADSKLKLKKKVTAASIKELITVTTGDEVVVDEETKINISSQGENQSILTVQVYGYNKEFCADILNAIKDVAQGTSKKVASSVAANSLSYIHGEYEMGYNDTVYTSQNDKASQLVDNESKINTLVTAANLEDGQKTYLDELLQSSATAEKSETKVEAPQVKVTVSKKYVVVGAFLGFFIVCCYVFISYLVGGRLHTRSEIESTYGVKQLGVIAGNHSKKKNAIDRLIHKIFKGRQRDFSYTESMDMMEASIKIAADKKEYKKILMTGSCINDAQNQMMDEMMEVLKAVGIDMYKTACVLYHPQAMIDMASADAVVLVETLEESLKMDVEKEIEAFDRQGIDVIGSIIFE